MHTAGYCSFKGGVLGLVYLWHLNEMTGNWLLLMVFSGEIRSDLVDIK